MWSGAFFFFKLHIFCKLKLECWFAQAVWLQSPLWNGFRLWSTDVAPEVSHSRPMRRDAATREGRHCSRIRPRHATWLFIFLSRLVPTRLRLEPICAESSLNQPKSAVSAETADSGRNSKKKKKVQNAPFELNLKSSFSSLHTNTPNFLY